MILIYLYEKYIKEISNFIFLVQIYFYKNITPCYLQNIHLIYLASEVIETMIVNVIFLVRKINFDIRIF